MTLLNCPFCGSELESEDADTLHKSCSWRNRDGYREYLTTSNPLADGFCYQINCPTIYGGCGSSISADSKEEVIEKWNTRVDKS
jgi:hypothetical protein